MMTSAMIDALLALVARIRVVEQRLSRAEQERIATAFLTKQIHTLGNTLQIVDLASAELMRRELADEDRLVTDLRGAALEARGLLATMIAVARPAPRTSSGAAVAPIVRATIAALASAGVPMGFETTIDDAVASRLAADELEALVLAAALDLATAPQVRFLLRERTIGNRRWLELLRLDDRLGTFELDLASPSLAGVVDQLARVAGGEVTLSPGRSGHELAIALPIA